MSTFKLGLHESWGRIIAECMRLDAERKQVNTGDTDTFLGEILTFRDAISGLELQTLTRLTKMGLDLHYALTGVRRSN